MIFARDSSLVYGDFSLGYEAIAKFGRNERASGADAISSNFLIRKRDALLLLRLGKQVYFLIGSV